MINLCDTFIGDTITIYYIYKYINMDIGVLKISLN